MKNIKFADTEDQSIIASSSTIASMPSSTILKEIAELSNPSALDYDPEDILPDYEASDSDEPEDVDAGREHYVLVRYFFFF